MAVSEQALSGRIAFTYPDFVLYQAARFLIVSSLEMQSVAVGWQAYELTHGLLELGLVGLAQFLPGFLLFLLSGHVADHFERRRLIIVCQTAFAICSALLLEITMRRPHSVYPIFLVLVLLGVVRSFNGPAGQAFLPQLVAEEHFPNAVAWGATIFQTATILGPMIGGLVYAAARGPGAVYGTAIVTSLLAAIATSRIHPRLPATRREPPSMKTVLAGFHYIWRKKLILGSISLDLFAVLLGGAVALLPVYAKEILRTGPWGLGLLRGAPGIGAAAMAILLAYRPIRRRAGFTMLSCVAGFGVFTVVFGLSRNLWISLLSLLLLGASDMVSVVIRNTLVQIATPDEMRGRVSAVNMLFIGASNEFGQFESGITAHCFGTVPAVVMGGLGTLVVIVLWSWLFPELRHADELVQSRR